MLDAVKAWRTAAVAHEHALDMYDVAADTDNDGMQADTQGLRTVAESLRTHASRLNLIDKRYENFTLQASIYACNEAIARIKEKHTIIAARLNDTADRLVQIADDYDIPRTDRKICCSPQAKVSIGPGPTYNRVRQPTLSHPAWSASAVPTTGRPVVSHANPQPGDTLAVRPPHVVAGSECRQK